MNQDIELAQKFERFFIINYSTVKNFAKMLIKSEEDAEDIAQDVFLKLWTQPEIWLENKETLDSYLYTMTKNTTFNFIKHRKIEQAYQEQIFEKNLLEELFDFNDPLDSIYYREIMLIFKFSMQRIPQKRRKVFEMSRFKKMTNAEIAEKLQISVRTVEHQIYLTLAELKKTLIITSFLLFF